MRIYKYTVALIHVMVMAVVIINLDILLVWIQEEKTGSLFFDFPIVVLLAAVPGIPFGMVSGAIGAKYGALGGSVISVIASTAAAVLIYALFRYLLQRQGIALLRKYSSLRHMYQFLKRHAFWALLIARIIPIMPAVLINMYAGVFGLSFRIFLLSTLLGKIPVMLAFTIIGDSIQAGTASWMGVIIIYFVFLLLVYLMYRAISLRQR